MEKDAVSKRPKYKNKKTMVNGIMFDSKVEAEYYLILSQKLQDGEITSLRLQPSYVLQDICYRGGKKINAIEYRADFEAVLPDGTVQVIDVKGQITEAAKMKFKMFRYHFPSYQLVLMKKVQKYGGWLTLDQYMAKKSEEAKAKKVQGRV